MYKESEHQNVGVDTQAQYQQYQNNQTNIEQAKSFLSSVKNHLTADFRKQLLFRKLIGLIIVGAIFLSEGIFGAIIGLVWILAAFVFWHYAFWSFTRGQLVKVVRPLLNLKIPYAFAISLFIQYLLAIWITLIAPFSGYKTWKMAVKNDQVLYLKNN